MYVCVCVFMYVCVCVCMCVCVSLQSTSQCSYFQQMAVKLYEKDPSKLTSLDEPLPAVSTSSDMSEDEDSNQAPEIKEEPMEMTSSSSPPLSRPAPAPASLARGPPGHPAAATSHHERSSFSSSHEDPSTDSETVSHSDSSSFPLLSFSESRQTDFFP